MNRIVILAVALALGQPVVAYAGVTSKIAKEAAEYVLRKFGREAEEQGLQTLTRNIEKLGVKYGDDAVTAVKKVGPRAFSLIDEAGDKGVDAIRLLAQYGDDAAWVVAKPNRLALFGKYGDEAAEAMIKQGRIAEPLIESIGTPAAGALKVVSTQNGRRLAIMAEDGTLAKIGRTDELLRVVGKYGDRAMNFVWRNKGTLALGAALTAFLADPQPFLDGTVELTKTATESIAKPLAAEIGRSADWTLVLPALAAVAALLIGLKAWLRHRLTMASRSSVAGASG
ncbi:MAG TPA: hypothetical protein VHC22_21740 [Pirellulales bacterium]|nr:hypothetical protein [Pirellulales bacterium]